MIHTQFTLTKKQYTKLFVEAMVIYYLKIYVATLSVGTILLSAIGKLTGNETFTQSSWTMFVTIIPVLLMCSIIAALMALFEARKTIKKHPELTEGSFKFKFEKSFMVMQINGKNNNIQYNAYRYHPGLSGSFILYQPQVGSIVIPKKLLTKEQRKTIKQFIKGI